MGQGGLRVGGAARGDKGLGRRAFSVNSGSS